jgi:hypothetical protein
MCRPSSIRGARSLDFVFMPMRPDYPPVTVPKQASTAVCAAFTLTGQWR